MKNPAPLSIPASLVLGAVLLAPLIGAAISLAQLSWRPLGYGAVASVGLLVVYAVGTEVAKARKARRIDLRAENGVHVDCDLLARSLESVAGSFGPSSCPSPTGPQALALANAHHVLKMYRVVRLEPESEEREPATYPEYKRPGPPPSRPEA